MAPKKSKAKPEVEKEVAAPVAEEAAEAAAPEAEAPEEAAPAEEASGKKGKVPEAIAGNGKFQAIEVKGGFVVFNPNGQQASGIVSDSEARDLVVKHNTAAGL